MGATPKSPKHERKAWIHNIALKWLAWPINVHTNKCMLNSIIFPYDMIEIELEWWLHTYKKLGLKKIWTKALSKINNASESIMFCTVETCTLHDKLFEGKKLEECDENLDYTYFEEQYEQLFPLDVFSHKWYNVHASNTCYNKRCSMHLGIVVGNSVIKSAYGSGHEKNHYPNLATESRFTANIV